MTKEKTAAPPDITREQMVQLLNEDLAGEYQAIIACTVHSQVLKGAAADKQKRQAEHVEARYEKKVVSAENAEACAWAAFNKPSGVGNKSGFGWNQN